MRASTLRLNRARGLASALMVILVSMIAGCVFDGSSDLRNSVPLPECASPPAEGAGVGFRILDHGNDTPFKGAARLVVRNESAWVDLWREHSPPTPVIRASNETNAPSYCARSPPHVDFVGESVVALFLGEQGGCSSLRVDGVDIINGSTRVSTTIFDGSPAAACPAVILHPFELIAVSAPVGPVIFEESSVLRP